MNETYTFFGIYSVNCVCVFEEVLVLDKNVFFVLNKVVEIVFSKMKLPRSILFFLPRFLSSFLSLVAGTLRVA